MAIEIERKFKLDTLPELYKINPVVIRQGYLITCADGAELRLRKKGEQFFQTFKKPGMEGRTEVETEISDSQFEELWPHTHGKRLEKIRYHYPLGKGLTAEIDVYSGKNEGLMVVEVEFKSMEEAQNFIPPDWFGTEVTDNKTFKNQNLAS